MSRDLILKDDDGVRWSYDNIHTQGWLEGHAPGLDHAVAYLKKHAVALFEAGKDAEATAMRKLAEDMLKKLRPEMEATALRHSKEHPTVLEGEDD